MSYTGATLPVISLWQPWASLIFAPGRPKRHETRSQPAPQKYLKRTIGVHATAKFPPLKMMSEELHELCLDTFGCNYNYSLPQGQIIGTVFLADYFSTSTGLPDNDEDRICGDWRPLRFAWVLDDVKALAAPIPAKGKQGWWAHPFPLTSAQNPQGEMK